MAFGSAEGTGQKKGSAGAYETRCDRRAPAWPIGMRDTPFESVKQGLKLAESTMLSMQRLGVK